EEAERKAVEEKTREEKARRSEEGRKGAEERADADRADPDRGDAARRSEAQRLSKERTERPENWHKLAAEAAKTAGAIWSLAETQDRVAEERVLRSQTVFGGPDHGGDSQLAVEVTFECTIIGRDRRLRATARGFDRKSGAGVAFRTEGEGTFGVRTRFRLDDQPAQDGLLFRERRDDTASILEVPMTASDVGKDAPRAGVWLRHYVAALEFDLVAGKVSATIAPYADNLRKVLEACAE